jgi:GNAT superfamily N-acetyltransferase
MPPRQRESSRSRRTSPPDFESPAGFAIERAGAHQLDDLMPLVDAFQREQGYAAGDAALRSAVRALLGNERAGAVLVLREDGAAIGYAALCLGFSIEFRGRDAFVDEIYVAPAWRGRGLGRMLVRALESQARALGVRQLHLEVEQGNDGARRLYLGEGFAATGRELLTKRLS